MVTTRRTSSGPAPERPPTPAPIGLAEEAEPHDIAAEEQELHAHIARLEKLKADRERLATLQAELAGSIPLVWAPPTGGQPAYSLDLPKGDNDIKIDDIPIFNNKFSIQRRHQWLINLQIAFEAAPNRYSSESKKVLGALRFMDAPSRVKWLEFLSEKTPDDRRLTAETWEAFEVWTLSLIQNTTSLRADIRDEIERAHQLVHQDPRDFHSYLHAREQHLTCETEENRALNFFSKLQEDLKREINRHVRPLPSTRDEMVDTAVHYWNIIKPSQPRKRPHPEQENQNPDRQKQSRTNDHRRSFQRNGGQPQQNRSRNPTGQDGKPLQCRVCKSTYHFARHCPTGQRVVQQLKLAEKETESR